jgi:O-antigen/teichoic acid export membrane protein
MAPKGLTRAVLRSGAWLGSFRLIGRLLDVVRLLILARLLEPRDFGLFGLGVLTVSWATVFSASDAQYVLIQRGERVRTLYDTAWTLGIIRRTLSLVVIVALAPLIARFFDSADATGIIRFMALLPLIRALKNVGLVEFRRDLTWGPEILLQMAGQVAELVVAIGLAVWTRSAWALAGGATAEAVCIMVLSYVRHPYRPRLYLGREEVREIFNFGRWEFGSRLVYWVVSDGLQAIIGRLLGVETLGLFRVAKQVGTKPAAQVGDVVGRITLGAYAKLRDFPERLRRAHLRVLGAVSLASTPVAVVMVSYGGEVAHHFLGPRWERAIPLVQILAVGGLMSPLTDAVASLFRGTGRPERHTMRSALELGILVIVLLPLALSLGAVGVALAVTLASSLATGVALWRAAQDLGIPMRELLLVLGGPVLASLPLLGVRGFVPGSVLATLPGLVAVLAGSAILYAVTLLVLARARLYPLATAVPTGFQHWLPRRARFDIARPV